MKTFIYKMIVVAILLIIGFEFTVCKRIDSINQNLNKFYTTEGRKELIEKLRQEMKKGLNKEYIIKNEEDRLLINDFINKIKSEINTTKKN